MNFFRELVAALMLLRLAMELVLSALNRAEMRRHREAPPAAVAAVMDPATYRRAVAYSLARSRFDDVSGVFDTAVLALLVFGGVLPALHGLLDASAASWRGALFIVLAGVLLAIPSLPFDWWETFRLEGRFGFNRSTPGLWLSDKGKCLAVSLLLGFPIVWALLALVRRAGSAWWLPGWGLVVVVELLLLVLYPKLILPLFNRLSPLPEGDLKDRLLALGERSGFKAASIHVMDGSRRSAHSNAFFTGFGRYRRIVLFDTLVAQLAPGELEAVLAHEIGHWRLGHVPRRLVLSALGLLAAFAAAAWLISRTWFNPSFGLPAGDPASAFLLLGLLGGLLTYWLTPLWSRLSRRDEYQADAFAAKAVRGAAPLIGALRKLSEKNLSNLTPHPLYSGFHYSHPTLVERERALGGS